MPLEKRQVLPNRFRYVCDSCSFDWPRTPVKESELPAPPAHSCRKQIRTESKASVDVPKTSVNEGTRPRPVAVCTRCGAASYEPKLINGQCGQMIAGKRCIGVNGSALNAGDWKECDACAGSGTAGKARCGRCDGAGWLSTRNRG